MKPLLYKLCLFNLLLIFSFSAGAQSDSLYIDSLKKVLVTEKEDTNKVITLDYLCSYYWNAGDYENTMQNARAVLTLSTKINYKIGIADGYLNMGLAYNVKKDCFNETEYFNKALTLYKETGDKQQILNCYDWMKDAYLMDGNGAKALESVYAAQKIREQTGDKKTIADGFTDIVATFTNANSLNSNLEEQLKNEFSALKLYKELNDKNGIGTICYMIGNVYSKQGKYTEALNQYAEALQLLKDSGRADHIANIYLLSGNTYEQQGDSAYDKGNKTLAADKYFEAEKNQLISLRKWQAMPYKPGVAGCYISLGNLNIKLKKLNIAKQYFDSSLNISQSLGDKQGLSNIYYGFAKIDSIQGDYKGAYKNYQLYKIYYDSANNEEDAKKTVQIQMQYDFDKKDAVAKAAQDKKDAEAKLRTYQEFFIFLGVIAIALIQYVSKRKKQTANLLLQQQKQKVENTLTELKSTQAQLIQSEKMASLGELTAGIAHEIQNPLNFVNNFSEVNNELANELKTELATGNLQLAMEIADDIIDNEQKINHHGKRADAIVKNMLQHSKQTKGIKEPTDINALCDEYLRLSYHGLRAKDKEFNAEMKTVFDNSIGKINIVPQDIGRVLLNLYNNAFYATSEKQKVSDETYKPFVSVQTKFIPPLEGKREAVEIIVSDNGNGIPQKVVDKIFQPFFTTKPTGQGTGLGLSLAYDIITKEHNGTIKVESKVDEGNPDNFGKGEGSEFIIQLPYS